MRLAFKCALAAIPAEMIFFGQFSYPVDDGYSSDDSLIYRIMSHLWYALHWPGLVSLKWLESRGASAFSELMIFVVSGYIQMAVLLFLVAFAFRWILRRLPWPRSVPSH
jgi:hypothetical protein